MGAASSVHVVAVSVRCAVGLSAPASVAAIRAGISRLQEHPALSTAAGEPLVCARVPGVAAELSGAERIAVLAEDALRDLAEDLRLARPDARLLAPVLLALPEARPGFGAERADWLRNALGARAVEGAGAVVVDDVGRGHAGALSALEQAVERVAKGRDPVCVAGGVDSYLDVDSLAWLESKRLIKREGVRNGFPPGEAAAFVAVASDAERRRLGLPSLARVRAVACARERRDPDSDCGLLGEGLTEAITRATRELRWPDETISDVYCDINGERARTEDWGFTLTRTAARFRDGTAYVTAAGECGDVGAASGALGCALAVQAWQRRYAHGPRALVWGASWGGLRGAALLEQEAG